MGELFIFLHTNRREANAALMTHQLGWERRLMIDTHAEVVQAQVSDAGGAVPYWRGMEGGDRGGWVTVGRR